MSQSTALVASVNIDDLVRKRGRVEDCLRRARDSMSEAEAILKSIDPAAIDGGASLANPILLEPTLHGRRRRHGFVVDEILEDVDARLWEWLMEKSGLLTFMDSDARTKWRENLARGELPPMCATTIEATFSLLFDQRAEFFERGVVNLFRSLSWSYRANSPVKLGKRLVLTHTVEPGYNGRLRCPYGSGADRLDDLLRVLAVLDGHPEPDHRQSARAQLSKHLEGPDAGSAVTICIPGCDPPRSMFEVRAFKNRNVHVRFLQPALVDQLNVIVAKHHTNVLPPASDDY